MTNYEYLQGLQLADLNWAILQAKAFADMELSAGTERTVRAQLNAKLEAEGEREYDRQLPDLEKHARLLSAEYREVQKSRLVDVVTVTRD